MFVFLFLAPAISLQAQEGSSKEKAGGAQIKWYTFQEAYNLNKKKPKKIFIDVYTEWCGWCKKMDATTFTDPVIAKYMNQNYYCVKFDAEQKDTIIIDGVTFTNPNPANKRSVHQLARELLRGNMSYPSYVFLNEKSQFLTVVPGYQTPKQFEPVLHYFAEDAFSTTSWDDYVKTFKGKIQ